MKINSNFVMAKLKQASVLLFFIILACQPKVSETDSDNAPVEIIESDVVSVGEEEPITEDKTVQLKQDYDEEIQELDEEIRLSESENNELSDEIKLYYKKIHILQTENDSMSGVINRLHIVTEALLQPEKEKVWTKDQQEIQKMIFAMHRSWKDLPENKDADEILKYFHPKFVVNRIAVETDDTAEIVGYNHEDFKFYLRQIIKDKGLSIQFGNTDFLNIEVKDNSYYNATYKCLLRSYDEDQLKDTSSLSVTVTGKKADGEWKIASYSWVSFKYK